MNLLLVEDDVGIGRFVSQGLSQRGWHVHWERSAAAVAALVATGKFNVVVLDLGLPDRDGLEICSEIRAAGSGLPILMLTARGALDDRLKGFAAGTDDYLSKPFAFEELAARVTVLLRRDRERQPDPLHYGKLTVTPASSSASWDGSLLELDPRGFALLLTLTRRGHTAADCSGCAGTRSVPAIRTNPRKYANLTAFSGFETFDLLVAPQSRIWTRG